MKVFASKYRTAVAALPSTRADRGRGRIGRDVAREVTLEPRQGGEAGVVERRVAAFDRDELRAREPRQRGDRGVGRGSRPGARHHPQPLLAVRPRGIVRPHDERVVVGGELLGEVSLQLLRRVERDPSVGRGGARHGSEPLHRVGEAFRVLGGRDREDRRRRALSRGEALRSRLQRRVVQAVDADDEQARRRIDRRSRVRGEACDSEDRLRSGHDRAPAVGALRPRGGGAPRRRAASSAPPRTKEKRSPGSERRTLVASSWATGVSMKMFPGGRDRRRRATSFPVIPSAARRTPFVHPRA